MISERQEFWIMIYELWIASGMKTFKKHELPRIARKFPWMFFCLTQISLISRKGKLLCSCWPPECLLRAHVLARIITNGFSHANLTNLTKRQVAAPCGLRMRTFLNTNDRKWPANFRKCFLPTDGTDDTDVDELWFLKVRANERNVSLLTSCSASAAEAQQRSC